MAIGASSHVVFDEQHLGIAETGSFVGLARRFRLSGTRLGTRDLRRRSFSGAAPPASPPPSVRRTFRSPAAPRSAGLLTLLRRHIPPGELAAACWQQWLSANRRNLSAERLDQAAAILQANSHDPVHAVLTLSQALDPRTQKPAVPSHGAHS